MKTITLELTDQQEHFLKMFAANHYPGAADNLATRKPIHVVQTRRERAVDPDYGAPDIVKYYVPDSSDDYDSVEEMIEAFWEGRDCPIKIIPFEEARYSPDFFIDVEGNEQFINTEEEYAQAYGIPKSHYYTVATEYYYEPVAYFFILAEAKRYIQYQGHNLVNPRTYTFGPGYANYGDFEHFWDLLFSIGKMLNEEEGGKAMAIHYAEQIDVVFDSFVNAIEGNNKVQNLRDTVMEINGDARGWARLFAIKCRAELENMEDGEE